MRICVSPRMDNHQDMYVCVYVYIYIYKRLSKLVVSGLVMSL